jgi:hypothetical protein
VQDQRSSHGINTTVPFARNRGWCRVELVTSYTADKVSRTLRGSCKPNKFVIQTEQGKILTVEEGYVRKFSPSWPKYLPRSWSYCTSETCTSPRFPYYSTRTSLPCTRVSKRLDRCAPAVLGRLLLSRIKSYAQDRQCWFVEPRHSQVEKLLLHLARRRFCCMAHPPRAMHCELGSSGCF